MKIYKTVIFPVVLYGCETWSLTLREEHRLSLYSSPNIVRMIKSRRMRWAGHVAGVGERRGVYRVLVGTPKGRKSLGRPRHRWEDNIKMDLREIGIDGANWIRTFGLHEGEDFQGLYSFKQVCFI
jgi:hypothetical protein